MFYAQHAKARTETVHKGIQTENSGAFPLVFPFDKPSDTNLFD